MTLDTLASNELTISRPLRVFWRRRDLKISLSKRTVQRYVSLLLILLLLSLVFQFVGATLFGLTSEIGKLLDHADGLNTERNEEIASIESVVEKAFSDRSLSTDVKKTIANIRDKNRKLNFDVHQAIAKANLFQLFATFGLNKSRLSLFYNQNEKETIEDEKVRSSNTTGLAQA